MNKITKIMMKKAEQDNMMYVVPVYDVIDSCNRLSRKSAGIEYCNPLADKDPYGFSLIGSPADIRKGIKYISKLEIHPLYESFPIMREGRIYHLSSSEGTWVVTRVLDMREITNYWSLYKN